MFSSESILFSARARLSSYRGYIFLEETEGASRRDGVKLELSRAEFEIFHEDLV